MYSHVCMQAWVEEQALECNYASNKSQIFEPRRRQEYNQADGEDNNVSKCHMCMVLLMWLKTLEASELFTNKQSPRQCFPQSNHVKDFLKRKAAIILSGTFVKASLSSGHVRRKCTILNKEEKALRHLSRDYKRRPWPQKQHTKKHSEYKHQSWEELARALHRSSSSTTTSSLVR